MKIQNILLPKIDICPHKELYYRLKSNNLNETTLISKESVLVIPKNTIISFDTYFNILSITKWEKYTNVEKFDLVLELSGDFEITLLNLERINDKTSSKVIDIITVSSKNKKKYIFPYNKYEYTGVLTFELKSLSNNSKFYGGYYDGKIDAELLKDVNIAIDICTYKREQYLKKNLDLFDKYIFNNKDKLSKHLKIYVIDNGQTLDEKLNNKYTKVIPNKNTGGVGGFTRGMIEIIKEKEKYTHVLLMDDDIVISPEAFFRTYILLQTIKDEYKDAFVGGAMLKLDNQAIQEESGASWNAGKLISNKHNYDLSNIDRVLDNETEEYTEYNAWWYCVMPIGVIKENNLPLPLFIRGDDVEYGLRNSKDIILLNGVCVWHESFQNKYLSCLHYYILRNMLYNNALHFPKFNSLNLISLLFKQFGREILYYRYKNVDLIFKAVDDFYKGIDFLKDTDAQKLNKQLNEMGYEQLDLDTIEKHGYHISDYKNSLNQTESKLHKLLRYITINGYLLPCKKTSKAINNIKTVSSTLCRPINFFREKEVLHFNPKTNTGFITKRKWIELIKTGAKFIGITIKTIFTFNKTKKDIINRVNEINNIDFWNKYLGIDV